jgi:hypothetical protein
VAAAVRPAPLFVALGAAAIAFTVAFVYPSIAGAPVAWYHPVEHAWVWEAQPRGVAMDFYGRTAQAIVAWAVVFAGALALAQRRAAISPRALGLVAAWTVTAIVFAMLFYAWTLHGRVPVPVPLPS